MELKKQYWLCSPGVKASQWDECLKNKFICIAWDELGDLSDYKSRDEITSRLQEIHNTQKNYTTDSLALWQFANEIQVGDIIFAKRGRRCIIGMGVVTSSYHYDSSRKNYRNIISVNWTDIGEWPTDDVLTMKTLTNISALGNSAERFTKLVKENEFLEDNCNYWWLNANPKYWSLSEWEIGAEQDYTLYNDNNHKRRIFEHLLAAKAGDKVICYETSPTNKILAIAIVAKEQDGEKIIFENIEALASPIDLETLRANKDLENMEVFANPNGSFFKLTEDEYSFLMDIIRDANPISDDNKLFEDYSTEDFLNEVFISESNFKSLKNLLINKKNIVLQGAPGVGKTFSAKRLAFALMGVKDESRICFVQFHQNYSYEDFVMGYKPNGSDFELQKGIFYKFCLTAQHDPDNEYFFIIDEINRGNLSKIFGELLLLIERDYRGKSIFLAYKDEKFSVPQNLFIIGMMNTADRSLAMIDYALRRRFSFYPMKPGFDTDGFNRYQSNLNSQRFNRLIQIIKDLNHKISSDESLGEGFEIGHSYFCGQEVISDEWLHEVINYDIIPTLQEYWFDNKAEVDRWRSRLNSIFDD